MSKGKRMPRKAALITALEFVWEFNEAIEVYHICGSVRRHKQTAGDIDLIIVPNDIVRFEDNLRSVFGTLKTDNRRPKTTGVYHGVPLQVTLALEDRVGAAKLFATGSCAFNKFTRSRAKCKGMKLNRTGLWMADMSKLVAAVTEDSIFDALKMPRIKPEYRDEKYKSTWGRIQDHFSIGGTISPRG